MPTASSHLSICGPLGPRVAQELASVVLGVGRGCFIVWQIGSGGLGVSPGAQAGMDYNGRTRTR